MMGKVIMSGIVPQLEYEAPVKGILASDLAVGSTVKLMENGAAVEYLVVHNGLPSSLYDSSCDGLWLLRKDCCAYMQWRSTDNNNYKESDVHSYLTSTFFPTLSTEVQAQAKTVKIPYVNGLGSTGSVASGSSGLSVQVFLLGGYEVGFTTSNNGYIPVDGACLEYFKNAENSKRIAKWSNAAKNWGLRSPDKSNNAYTWYVNTSGSYSHYKTSDYYGVRPALILPSTALFDEETLILKGVA